MTRCCCKLKNGWKIGCCKLENGWKIGEDKYVVVVVVSWGACHHARHWWGWTDVKPQSPCLLAHRRDVTANLVKYILVP
jgi:hypothetical protein